MQLTVMQAKTYAATFNWKGPVPRLKNFIGLVGP